MAKCKCSKCGSTRIVSNIVQNMPNGCFDVYAVHPMNSVFLPLLSMTR